MISTRTSIKGRFARYNVYVWAGSGAGIGFASFVVFFVFPSGTHSGGKIVLNAGPVWSNVRVKAPENVIYTFVFYMK